MNVIWLEPKNFFLDRLPSLLKYYLFGPSRLALENHHGFWKEHLHPQAIVKSVDYVLKGFAGIGSI